MTYPTDRTLYWRLDSTAGSQDGTTDTAGNSGTAAFESLDALIDYVIAQDADLTGQGPLTLITSQGGREIPVSLIDFNGITTTATDYLLVQCTGDARNNGVSFEHASGSGYQMQRSGDACLPTTPYIRFIGMEFCTTSDGANAIDYALNPGVASSDVRFDECLFTCTNATVTATPCVLIDGDATYKLTNCLIIANGHRGMDSRGGTTICEHVGIVANNFGWLLDSSDLATNCWAMTDGGSEDFFQETAAGSLNNGSSDASAPPSGTGAGEVINVTPTDEVTNYTKVPSTADLTLKDSLFNGAGTGAEAIDITGATRTGSPDIGPFNFAGELVNNRTLSSNINVSDGSPIQ